MSGSHNLLSSYKTASGGGNGLLTNLESYYKLDESSGTIIDAHGTDDSTAASVTYGATGKINNCLDFESGSSNYVSFGNAKDFSAYSGVSISCWFNLESLPSGAAGTSGSYRYFYGSTGSGFSQVYLRYQVISGVYYLYFGTYNVTDKYTRYAITLSTGTWYHVLGTHDGSNWDLYLNGSAVSTTITSGAITSSPGTDAIGCRAISTTYDRFHDGLLDEVAIWSRELDATDASTLYNSGSGLAYSSFTS